MANSTANEPLISFAASKIVAHRGDLHVDLAVNLSAVSTSEIDVQVHCIKDKNAPIGQVASSRSDYVPTVGTVKDTNSQLPYYTVKFPPGQTQATVRILLESNEIPLSKPIYFAAKLANAPKGLAKLDATKELVEIEIDPVNTTPAHTATVSPMSLSISGKTPFTLSVPGSGNANVGWFKNGSLVGSYTQVALPWNVSGTADVFGTSPFNGAGTYVMAANFPDGTTANSGNVMVSA